MNSQTVYPKVNETLDILKKNLSHCLGDHFIGMYLFGSLALDDFFPDRSDLDIVVMTEKLLSEEQMKEIKLMHATLIQDAIPYASNMECIYIPQESLQNYVQKKAFFPCLHNGGDFYVDGFGLIEKHVLREHGIILKGPNPTLFIAPVTSAQLKMAAHESLTNWWLPKLKNSTSLVNADYQTFAVLTMCRALYTIDNGEVASKSQAVIYAKNTVDPKYHALIDDALVWKFGDTFHRLDETLDFMKFTLNRAGVS